jgi:hypothetical protein
MIWKTGGVTSNKGMAMIVQTAHIEYNIGQKFQLKPIFDVHIGNKFCDMKEFKKYIESSDIENTYFIGGGDLIDAIVTTDKRYRKNTDDTQGDSIIDEQVESLFDVLKPYRKNILGLGEGNHEDVIVRKCGTNPTNNLCKMLSTDDYKVPFLGYSCLYKVYFSYKGGRGRSFIIRQHHGWGGGSRTRGANITKFERDMGKWDADLFLYGHVHQKQTDKFPRMGMCGSNLVSKPQIMCICGTFLKTFSDTPDPTYSEVHGFPAVDVGGIIVNINIGRDTVELKVET